MSPDRSAVLAESANDVALIYHRKLIVAAPRAPWAMVSLCSRILADPRTSSDAALLVADGLREVAADAERSSVRLSALGISDRQAHALQRLADVMESEAPSRARTRQP